MSYPVCQGYMTRKFIYTSKESGYYEQTHYALLNSGEILVSEALTDYPDKQHFFGRSRKVKGSVEAIPADAEYIGNYRYSGRSICA